MNNSANDDVGGGGQPRSLPQRPGAVVGLVAVLTLELLAISASAVFFGVELLANTAGSIASGSALTVVIVIAAVWVFFIIRGVLRGQAWTRAAIVVLQILIIAVAVGSFQGEDARPDLAVALLTPAVVALVLVFRRSVGAVLTNREDRTI